MRDERRKKTKQDVLLPVGTTDLSGPWRALPGCPLLGIHLFFHKVWWGISAVPGTVPGAQNTVVNRREGLQLHGRESTRKNGHDK